MRKRKRAEKVRVVKGTKGPARAPTTAEDLRIIHAIVRRARRAIERDHLCPPSDTSTMDADGPGKA